MVAHIPGTTHANVLQSSPQQFMHVLNCIIGPLNALEVYKLLRLQPGSVDEMRQGEEMVNG